MKINLSLKISYIIIFIITFVKFTFQKITISTPDELARLFKHEQIKVNFANFGKVPYGHNFMGKLHYDLADKEADYACRPLTGHNIDFEISIDRYPIVMVDRGNCTFVTKARNIQNIGGLFALIINNNDDGIDNLTIADDGTGSDIYIPTVLISKKDGEIVKKFMLENKDNLNIVSNIIFSIEFHMRQLKTVQYQLFFTSSNLQVYQLLKEFKKYNEIISNMTEFKPHYITYISPDYNSTKNKNVPNCISKGLYCASPRYDLGITDGKDIITENIRQKCIFFISKGKFKNPIYGQKEEENLYWEYMERFYDKCLNRTVVGFNYKCSTETLIELGINELLVNDCVTRSYIPDKDKLGVDMNNNNSLLEEEYNVKKQWRIKVFPTVLINNKTLQGSWSADNLLEGICAGLFDKPQICYEKGYFFKSGVLTKVSFGTIFVLVLILIGLNILIYILCRRYIIKRINQKIDNIDMNARINTVVTSYLALKDTPA